MTDSEPINILFSEEVNIPFTNAAPYTYSTNAVDLSTQITTKYFPLLFSFSDGCRFECHGANFTPGYEFNAVLPVTVKCPHGLTLLATTAHKKGSLTTAKDLMFFEILAEPETTKLAE